jgi:hypothetical protein
MVYLVSFEQPEGNPKETRTNFEQILMKIGTISEERGVKRLQILLNNNIFFYFCAFGFRHGIDGENTSLTTSNIY